MGSDNFWLTGGEKSIEEGGELCKRQTYFLLTKEDNFV